MNNRFDLLDSSSEDNNTDKRMLCFAINTNRPCIYGDRCTYAHNLNEQKVYSLRKRAYDIITSDCNLDDINLYESRDLYNELYTLSKLCTSCAKNTCSGGYNCKYGVLNAKYQICLDDLNTGYCRFRNCKRKHLTERGLIPFNVQKKRSESIFVKKNRKLKIRGEDIAKSIINSTSSDTESEDFEQIKKKIMYLNTMDSDNSEEESIFIE